MVKNDKSKIQQLISVKEEDLETHFVANPFIKMKEKMQIRELASKNMLSAKQLGRNNADVVIVKESGKFEIRDLEDEEEEKKQLKNRLKRGWIEKDSDDSD